MILTSRSNIAAWYLQHGEELVNKVRHWLGRRAPAHVSGTQILQSVWASFMAKHLDKVDVTDENGDWNVLAEVAKRHCNRHLRHKYRHPTPSLDTLAPPGPSGEPGRFDPEDTRTLSPVKATIAMECAQLLKLSGGADEEMIAGLAQVLEGKWLGLVEILDPEERAVFAHKLARLTRPQIAAQMKLTATEVDELWKSVKLKAWSLSDQDG